MAKVSIVMPVYNAIKYLDQAIQSLINQTLEDIEIICVDDGSSDGSYEKLLEFAAKDNRIVVAKNENESDGAAQARNIGMDLSTSEWLAFMDADDFAEDYMLEKAYKKANECQPDILFFNAWYYDDENRTNFVTDSPINGKLIPNKESFCPSEYKEKIFFMTHGAVWGRLFKKEFVELNDLDFFSCHYWDDIEFFYTALCLAKKVTILNECLMHYRWNASNNQTSNVTKHPEIAYKATLEIKKRFIDRKIYDVYKVPLLNFLLVRAVSVLQRLDDARAFETLFFELKSRYLAELGSDELAEEEYDSQALKDTVFDIINANSPLEYLINKSRSRNDLFYKGISDLMSLTNGPASFVIYGAGVNGRKYFNTILSSKEFTMVGWLDRDYERIGYPVKSPETILELDYDYVLITIESNEVASKVKDYLIEKGVNPNRIIWPYNIS